MPTAVAGPGYVIDGPIPNPPLYRLLDNAQIEDIADPHWQVGAQVWGYPTDLPYTWDGCGDHGTFTKSAGGPINLPEFAAFTVVQPITCSMRGIDPDDIDGWQARAVAAFTATESYAIENELAQGTNLPLNPHFTDSNVTLLNGSTATPSKKAIGLLVDAVGATAQQGLLHATPGAIIGFQLLDIYREANKIYSADGVPIVRGTGYFGATPSGGTAASAGQSWAYATGPIKIVRGPIYGIPEFPYQALDRENNVYTFRAERNYLVMWDTALQAAVKVDWTA